jgi:antibiotic biosynthesis monooxygenase (ABM) superfamily enzyme
MKAAVQRFPGFEDLNVLPRQDHYLALLDFADVKSLTAWTDSKERHALLERLHLEDGEQPQLEVRRCNSVVELESPTLTASLPPKWKLLLVNLACELPTNLVHAKLDTLAHLRVLCNGSMFFAILGLLLLTVPWLVYAPIALLTRLSHMQAWINAPRAGHQSEPMRTLDEGLRIFQPSRDEDLINRLAMMERRAHALRHELEHIDVERAPEIRATDNVQPSVDDFMKAGALTKGRTAAARDNTAKMKSAPKRGRSRGRPLKRRQQARNGNPPLTGRIRHHMSRRNLKMHEILQEPLLGSEITDKDDQEDTDMRDLKSKYAPVDVQSLVASDVIEAIGHDADRTSADNVLSEQEEARVSGTKEDGSKGSTTSVPNSVQWPEDKEDASSTSAPVSDDECHITPRCHDHFDNQVAADQDDEGDTRLSESKNVTVAILHTVRWHCRARFLRFMVKFRETMEHIPGYVSLNVIAEPVAHSMDDPKFTLLYKFQSWEALEDWECSQERRSLLIELNKLLNDKPRWHVEEESALVETAGEVHDALTALWATAGRAAPPIWKVVLLSMTAKEMVLLPLNLHLAPHFAELGICVALKTVLVSLVGAVLVVYVTVPLVKLPFNHWLNDPCRRPSHNAGIFAKILDGGLPSNKARLWILLLYAMPMLALTQTSMASNVQLL